MWEVQSVMALRNLTWTRSGGSSRAIKLSGFSLDLLIFLEGSRRLRSRPASPDTGIREQITSCTPKLLYHFNSHYRQLQTLCNHDRKLSLGTEKKDTIYNPLEGWLNSLFLLPSSDLIKLKRRVSDMPEGTNFYREVKSLADIGWNMFLWELFFEEPRELLQMRGIFPSTNMPQ